MNNGSGKEVDKSMRSYGDPIPFSRWSARVQWHTVAPDYRSQLRKKRLQQYGPASGGGESKHNRFRLQHKVNFILSGPWTARPVGIFSRLCRREPGTEDPDLVEGRTFYPIKRGSHHFGKEHSGYWTSATLRRKVIVDLLDNATGIDFWINALIGKVQRASRLGQCWLS